ncbi:phospho-sugar mutase [Naumannella halotolerans]|uniref:Phosphomannomutase n=1 Tax=Naumannella halotolerans TaxID=993414 RepID=A0A4R7J9F5_9ACTN|nr:phospho-sugar mutase [Naumannella halotolerans]TDT34151.1 phosphomannomutase [Naumannella halotolerans]
MSTGDPLLDRARAWQAADPDPVTASELGALVAAAEAEDRTALAELADAFDGDLEFGTAGLRGRLGPGPNRMNRVVVGRAAAGLGAYLDRQGLGGGRVIIGFDARHNSEVFAADSAELLAGAGFEVLLAPGPVPTPVVAWGIGAADCVAGIVVTASHNPPVDNGYKVYLGDGSQIVPPADAEIAAQIAAVGDLADLPRSEDWAHWGPEILTGYIDRAAELGARAAGSSLRWVHTAMHGVGSAVVRQVVARAGIPAPIEVAAQAEPDPDFPTVSFPNPEEPGAIDLAIATAVRAAEADGEPVDLVVANDPDADRCAVAIPTADGWRMLTGNELGWLLAEDFLARGVQGAYACSIVSSILLSQMAADHGQRFVPTLTGFKWIGRVPGLAFGYEEAIGYCCDPQHVPDKDGITALSTILAIAAEAKAAGTSFGSRLDRLATRYGRHLTDQLSVRVEDLSIIAEAMSRLRAQPPSILCDRPVEVTDLLSGSDRLPPTDGVLLEGDGVRAVVRPSGTEPKLKAYLEVWSAPPAEGASGSAVDPELSVRLTRLRADMTTALGL